MTEGSVFRGYREIETIRARVLRLIEGYRLAGKPAADIRLKPVDYDLVARWPKASAVHGFLVSASGVTFEGRDVKRITGISRYPIKKETKSGQGFI